MDNKPEYIGYHEPGVETAARDSRLLEDAIKGVKANKLAEKYDLSLQTVRRILREATKRVREDNAGLIEEAFMLQLARIERLYELVEKALQRYEADGTGFDDRPFRIAIQLFDRQAKLLGLDKVRVPVEGNQKFFTNAPIDQILAYAKQLRIAEPTEFET